MALEVNIAGEEGISRSLLGVQDFFDASSRDIVDESDENFSVKFELIYTIGAQGGVDMTPDRWLCIHEILDLIRRFSPATANKLPGSLELTHCAPGHFARTRILKSDAQDDLLGAVAFHICDIGINGFPIARQAQAVRTAVFTYITKLDLTVAEVRAVEKGDAASFCTGRIKEMLLLLRGLFAAGVLSFVFGQKRWRVNYGLDSSRTPPTKLAVPYRAKDMPSPRSEFSHPDVIIMLTNLSYYYGGLHIDDLRAAFDHLSRSDQAESAYQTWVRDSPSMPTEFKQLDGINLRDKHQFATDLFPAYKMREFPFKLSASGWDIGKEEALPTTGFSGTNDSRTVLPLDIEQADLAAQQHTNALVLEYLLQDDNGVAEMPVLPSTQSAMSDAERLLDMVMKLDPPPRVILDVGARILELSNIEVAKRWLHLCDSGVQAAVFFDEHDELSVVNRRDRVEALQTSSFATQLDVCLVFLDESHTRGTDLRLPESYRAAVTLGAGLTKDRLTQACMRMRKLGKGQTVVFCVPSEIKARIAACTAKPLSSRIVVRDILHWTISETWADMRRSMPLWAAQGVRFVRQDALWKNAQDREGCTTLSRDQAKAFREEEAQSLKTRYKPTPGVVKSLFKGQDHGDVSRIQQRCHDFEKLSFASTTLQEEQERKLSPEIERELQKEKPHEARPASHTLHPDLNRFVTTGILRLGSQAWLPAFTTLKNTSAAECGFSVTEMRAGEPGAPNLLVTADFAKTIRTPMDCEDFYKRPVEFVLTTSRAGVVAEMIIVSPFEAEVLYKSIEASTKVVLHRYSPRCNSGYRSLDRLDFYTVPHQHTSLAIPPRLIAQLNLFSGQLYINDYEDFQYMCAYLGLATETAPEGWEVSADGFIIKDGLGRVGGESNLTSSPVKFLQMLMAIRKDGQGFSKTHMGALLEGRLLQAEDFEES
ncbi:hypothetical protein LTR27_008957 [Elasticomyces elasticus]|nr:hypothetical protein LTR27_008957 [Elasticomyces elasticus]